MKRSLWVSFALGLFACDAFREPPTGDGGMALGSGGRASASACGHYKGTSFSIYQPFQTDLYTWLSEEQAADIIEGEVPLLERATLPTTILEDFNLDLFDDFGSSAPLEVRIKQSILGDDEYMIATWPFVFATYRETSPPQDQLLHIQLRPEAWILVISEGKSLVYDADNQLVDFELVVDEPWRLAGVYGTHSPLSREEFEQLGKTRRPVQSCTTGQIVEVGERAFVLTNPLMFERFSVGGDESFQELAREKANLVEYLEQMRTTKEPANQNSSLPCFWAQYNQVFSADSCVGYLSNLNSTDTRYSPTVRNLVQLLDTLNTVQRGPSFYSEGPAFDDLMVPVGGAGGKN